KDYVVSDSDEFLSIELSDLAHFFRTGFRKGSVDDAAVWAEQFASKRHRMLFDHVVRMHTGMRDHKAWETAEKEAAEVASAIKEKLATPWTTLLSEGNQAYIRRTIRKNLDRQLEIENCGVRRWWPFLRPSTLLIDTYKYVIHNVPRYRIWYFGSLDRPRFFTTTHMVRGLLKDDLLQLVGDASDIVLVSDDPSKSILFSILSATGHRVVPAVGFRHDRELGLWSRDMGRQLSPSSCNCVVVEPGRLEPQDVFAAAYHVLQPGGRLLALSGWSNDTPPLGREQAESLMSARFRIKDHRQQGGIGAVEFYRSQRRLKELARRNPVLARLAEFLLPMIWVPLFVITSSIGRGWGVLRDFFDHKRKVWFTSLTLAEKAN
ncbi:MAG TPA: hypothetical protein VG897_12925, partial [Terriglobales bacterium]|nr:hypothetical protein [Terriglobales bacterium]